MITFPSLLSAQYDNPSINSPKGQAGQHIKFEHLSIEQGLSYNRITCFLQDKKGFLWIITTRGLDKFFPETGDVIKYADIEDHVPLRIQQDAKGNIWLGTRDGLCRFDTTTNQVTRFNFGDGLPIRIINFNGSFSNKQGKFYFAGVGGFYSFYPDSIKINECIPRIALTDFKLLQLTPG